MPTATKQARASRHASHGALVSPESEPMEFVIVEDNGGAYHWTLLDRTGNGLARSPSFASYRDAENAARVVLAGAGSARLERSVDADSVVEAVTRGDEAAAQDGTDAERWLDEGGSFSRKAART